jgi:hypothetical protein
MFMKIVQCHQKLIKSIDFVAGLKVKFMSGPSKDKIELLEKTLKSQ